MRWPTGIFAIGLGLTWLGLAHAAPAADDQRAREIVDRVTRLYLSRSSLATVEMQITKEDSQRQLSLQFWSLGESNILIRIRRPPADAGTAILKVGRQLWYYLPKANRTVKMPAAMMAAPWLGSHFTLDDLVKESRLTNDYLVATSFAGQRDGVLIAEYTLTPKPTAVVVWGKITLEIRPADLMPVRQRYYDEEGRLVRELTYSGYKTVSGRLLPTRLVMESMDKAAPKAGARAGVLAQGVMRPQDQAVEQTTITYEDIAFDVPMRDGLFSPGNLKP